MRMLSLENDRVFYAALTVLAALFLGSLIASGVAFKEYMQPQTFSNWFAAHQQTCPTCSSKYDENGQPGPICEEAFTRLQEAIKRGDM